jgi:hypothetical protein
MYVCMYVCVYPLRAYVVYESCIMLELYIIITYSS